MSVKEKQTEEEIETLFNIDAVEYLKIKGIYQELLNEYKEKYFKQAESKYYVLSKYGEKVLETKGA